MRRTEEFLELKRLHDRFLANYRSMQFCRSRDRSRAAEDDGSRQLQKVYAEYQARLDAYPVEPPPADWDGS